jgi:hypothetical protein
MVGMGPTLAAEQLSAWQIAGESSRKSGTAWRSGLTIATRFPKSLRMGAVLSKGWLRVESEKRLAKIVPEFAPHGVTEGKNFGNTDRGMLWMGPNGLRKKPIFKQKSRKACLRG